MTPLLDDALRAGQAGRRAAPPAASAVLVGAGGALGAAVLEQLLAGRRFAPLRVLVTQRLRTAALGLEAVPVGSLLGPDGAGIASPTEGADADDRSAVAPLARTAIVVLDRARRANGREDAFARPSPDQLLALCGGLRRGGARHLVVVLSHDPARLPQALKAGLANLDEHAVATLGFEHVVFVRPAEIAAGDRAERWLQRVADGVLAQLRLMQPAASQPVRVAKVAQFVAELAQRLPTAAPGTRVAAPELLWQAAQQKHCGELVAAWLDGRALPALSARRMRL